MVKRLKLNVLANMDPLKVLLRIVTRSKDMLPTIRSM